MYTKKKQLFHNKLPSRRKRSDFSQDTKAEIREIWGDCCYICESPQVQFHHVKYRSQSGRGTKRNGLPLCNLHHNDHTQGIHHNSKLRKRIEELFIRTFGEEYFKDEYDLYLEGKINEPNKDLLEEYFKKGEAIWLK